MCSVASPRNESGGNFIDPGIIEQALRNLYHEMVDVTADIEPNLFKATLDIFNKAVDEGFGRVEFGNPDFDFVNDLKYSNAVFSAFKTHRQQNDMAKLLTDDEGNLKSFSQFKKDTQHLIGAYNQNWLATEYNTAVLRASSAAQFKKFERDADLYPNLKWLQSTSVDKREGHVKFYGIVKAITDPFWKEHYPGNLWNCKCDITNTDEPADRKTPKADYDPAPGLDENPAYSHSLFSKSNPYQKNAYKGASVAVASMIEEVPHFETIRKFKNGGVIQVHSWKDRKDTDFKSLLNICNHFATAGATTHILPKAHVKDSEYSKIFGSLKNTKYWGKCPDMDVNGIFYEYESFLGKHAKNKLFKMLARGLKQSSRIVINDPGVTDNYINKIIKLRIAQGQVINEVWIMNGSAIRRVF